MFVTEPTVEERESQAYVGIAATPTMAELDQIVPTSLDRVFTWLADNRIEPAGPPFLRLNVIDMEGVMQVEVGVPVGEQVDTSELVSGELPGGRFATLVYADPSNGIAANAALIDWAKGQDLVWDRWEDPAGDAFACRLEWLLDGPEDDPDPANWRTEIAIKLA